MLRFILRCRMKDRFNGLETDTLYSHDVEVPDLESLLLRGGLSEDGYEVHEVVGVEVFPAREVGEKVAPALEVLEHMASLRASLAQKMPKVPR